MALPLTIVFFPGVVLHELSHVFACAATGVKVQKVKWFGVTEAYVQHDKPRAFSGLIISLAPLLVNNVLGYFLLSAANNAFSSDPFYSLILFWLGVSLVIFSFPSKPDAENTFNAFLESFAKRTKAGNPVLTRIIWYLLSPLIFIPLVLLLGLVLVFESVFFLRILWLVGMLVLVVR